MQIYIIYFQMNACWLDKSAVLTLTLI